MTESFGLFILSIFVWIGVSLSSGLSQNHLVKVRTAISCDHTDNWGYNKTKISALSTFEKRNNDNKKNHTKSLRGVYLTVQQSKIVIYTNADTGSNPLDCRNHGEKAAVIIACYVVTARFEPFPLCF